jgi:predicted short-subunit dehydrogenase-like oxidoreductase (DUF2520 family)
LADARWPADAALPDADLVVVGVRDDAIAAVCAGVVPRLSGAPVVCHLSGSVSVGALDAAAAAGHATASFHPLQTLPDPVTGAASLAGCHAAVTTLHPAAERLLFGLARTLDMVPFALADDAKPGYHAAASASSNFVAACLALADDLARSAGVPFSAFQPLTRTTVDNVWALGPRAALTGPVARGDLGTVRRQLAATRGEVAGAFRHLVAATALLAGTAEVIGPALEEEA